MTKINEVEENSLVKNEKIGNLSGEVDTILKNQREILM